MPSTTCAASALSPACRRKSSQRVVSSRNERGSELKEVGVGSEGELEVELGCMFMGWLCWVMRRYVQVVGGSGLEEEEVVLDAVVVDVDVDVEGGSQIGQMVVAVVALKVAQKAVKLVIASRDRPGKAVVVEVETRMKMVSYWTDEVRMRSWSVWELGVFCCPGRDLCVRAWRFVRMRPVVALRIISTDPLRPR